MTLKPRPDIDGPVGRGPLPSSDPCPLTSAEGGVVPISSYPACGSPRPSTRDASTEAVDGASSSCKSRAGTGPSDAWVQPHTSK